MTDAIILNALEATWPAARSWRVGPWTVRQGLGGGQRVSAATLDGDPGTGDRALAEAAMQDLGQASLFMVRDGEAALDAELTASGYRMHDPVVIYAAPCAVLTAPEPNALTGFPHWPPLAIAMDIWAEGGIGPTRLAVMDRVAGPKAALLGRLGDRPAGVGFVGVQGAIAVLHALDVSRRCRRQGAGQALLRHAALWAAAQGADQLILAVTAANGPARAMYDRLGLKPVGQYHYRVL